MNALSPIPFDPAVQLSQFYDDLSNDNSNIDAGGIVNFIGRVRQTKSTCAETGQEQSLQNLTLQAYGTVTEQGIQDSIKTAQSKWPLQGVKIIHRTGDMAPSDPIVMVLTAAKHRRDAFEACDFLMDYLKTHAIFWKKETLLRADGHISTRWIEPRAQDYQDQQRWS